MGGYGREACVCRRAEDADSCTHGWSARIGVPGEPRNEQWGARTFDLLDPSGTTIFVVGSALETEGNGTPLSQSLIPECADRVQVGGPSRRQQASQQRDQRQERRRGRVDPGVARLHLVQQARHEAAGGESAS